jgi:2'-5' RNA ligase
MFDVAGARKAGYSDDEIADFLAQQVSFDVSGARKAGYSSPELVDFLSGQLARPKIPAPATSEFTTGAEPAPPSMTEMPDRTWGEVVSDTAISAQRGTASLMSGLSAVSDMMNPMTAIRRLQGGTTFNKEFGEALDGVSADLATLYSEKRKKQGARWDATDGFVESSLYLLQNPSFLADIAVESAPGTLAGGAVGRAAGLGIARNSGLEKKLAAELAQKGAAWGSGAAEAIQAYGQVYRDIEESLDRNGVQDAGQRSVALSASLPASIATLAFGRMGGSVESKIFGPAFGKAAGGAGSEVLKDAAREGLEEVGQSAGEQLFTNIGKKAAGDELDITTGVGKAMAAGGLVGAAQGGAISGARAGLDSLAQIKTASEIELTGDPRVDIERILSAPVTEPVSAEEILGAPQPEVEATPATEPAALAVAPPEQPATPSEAPPTGAPAVVGGEDARTVEVPVPAAAQVATKAEAETPGAAAREGAAVAEPAPVAGRVVAVPEAQAAAEGVTGQGATEGAKTADSPIAARRAEPNDYSSAQLRLGPEDTKAAFAAGAKIAPEDLAEKGMERPHITIKHGLHDNDPSAARSIISKHGPITVTVGNVEILSPRDKDYDVVVQRVDSPELRALNKELSEKLSVTETHPEYKPHITIGYVKRGLGTRYANMKTGMEGRSMTFGASEFSGKDGSVTPIKLGGGDAKNVRVDQGRGLQDEPAEGDVGEGSLRQGPVDRGARVQRAEEARAEAGDRKRLSGVNMNALRGRTVTIKAEADDGKSVEITGDAGKLVNAMNRRVNSVREVLNCLRR